jgi:hypothetical protein
MTEQATPVESAQEAVETITGGGETEKVSAIEEINEENFDPSLPQQESVEATPETQEELVEAVEEAIEEGASEEEVKEMIKEFELKVNGKKKKVKIDLNNEEELIRRLQMAEAGQSAMQEKAELEKAYMEYLKKAQQDPTEFLADLGIDPDDFAEKRLSKKVEELKKSPEQIEREQMQAELAKMRAELKRRETEAEEARVMQLQQEAQSSLNEEIVEALQSSKTLPNTPKTVRRIADAMIWALENTDYEDIAVKDVLPAVEKEIKAEITDFISGLGDDEDLIESYIGASTLNKLRKKRLAAAKKARTLSDVKPVSTPKKEEDEEKARKIVSSKDFFRNLK